MTKIFNHFPDELTDPLRQFSMAWATSDLRPKPDRTTLAHWTEMINSWVASDDMPLFIRKKASGRGNIVQHPAGRKLLQVDNSPAQWVYSLAMSQKKPSLQEIRDLIRKDQIPIAMILTREENKHATLLCSLTADYNVNILGWKLAHIEGVGLNTRTPLEEQPIEVLKQHFVRLMMPTNMFLIPIELGGLAEVQIVIDEMKKQLPELSKITV